MFIPQIDELQGVAVEAKSSAEDQVEGIDAETDPGELVDDDTLDPLF